MKAIEFKSQRYSGVYLEEIRHNWQKFRDAQQEITLPAGKVAHIAVTIRDIDVGADIHGTILFMHDIPTWGVSIMSLYRY